MGDYKFIEGETMEAIQATLGLRIRTLRKERNMSQLSLVMRTNLAKSYIYLLETGSANPTLLALIKIAYALDVDVVELLTDID
jgi:transcriptional regulator with XRE-family HTH domain